jgi:hypothetical protein
LMIEQHPKQHSSSKCSGRIQFSTTAHVPGASQSMLATLAMLDHVQQRLHTTPAIAARAGAEAVVLSPNDHHSNKGHTRAASCIKCIKAGTRDCTDKGHDIPFTSLCIAFVRWLQAASVIIMLSVRCNGLQLLLLSPQLPLAQEEHHKDCTDTYKQVTGTPRHLSHQAHFCCRLYTVVMAIRDSNSLLTSTTPCMLCAGKISC